MSDGGKLSAANIKRLAEADEHRRTVFDWIREVVVDMRQQFPTRGKPFPNALAIHSWLTEHGVKAPNGGEINLTYVKRTIAAFRDDFDAIPSARVMEDALPEPPIYRGGIFRLIADIDEADAGEYGAVRSFDGETVIADLRIHYANETGPKGLRLSKRRSGKMDIYERIELRPNQIRMVPRDLYCYYSGYDAEHEAMMIRRITGEEPEI